MSIKIYSKKMFSPGRRVPVACTNKLSVQAFARRHFSAKETIETFCPNYYFWNNRRTLRDLKGQLAIVVKTQSGDLQRTTCKKNHQKTNGRFAKGELDFCKENSFFFSLPLHIASFGKICQERLAEKKMI